jgi:hypothetical protein
MAGRGREG